MNLTKPIQQLFNDEKFRAEYTHTLSRQVCLRAKLPHYVVICGNEFDRAVKYSRKSLLLAYFNKDYMIMMYEVPSMTFNSIQDNMMLRDAMLEVPKGVKNVNEQLFSQIKVETNQIDARTQNMKGVF